MAGLLITVDLSSFNKSETNFLYSEYEWLNNAFAIDFLMILFCL
jgi:hypothetical protein